MSIFVLIVYKLFSWELKQFKGVKSIFSDDYNCFIWGQFHVLKTMFIRHGNMKLDCHMVIVEIKRVVSFIWYVDFLKWKRSWKRNE